MAIYCEQYDIHETEGKQKFIDMFIQHMKPLNGKIVWHALCMNSPVVKNIRPEYTGETTMTERSVRADAGPLQYHGDYVTFRCGGYIQFIGMIDPAGSERIFAYRRFTLSLSNPDYVPVDTPEYFMARDSRPCKALLIFDEGEPISKFRMDALRFEGPLNWVGRAANEFLKTFG